MYLAKLEEKAREIAGLKLAQFDTWDAKVLIAQDEAGVDYPYIGVTATRGTLYSAVAFDEHIAMHMILDRYVPKMDLAIRKAEEKAGVVQ